jgi:hypothetical protein
MSGGHEHAPVVPSVAVRSRPDARFPRVAGASSNRGLSWKQAPALESSLGPRSSPEDATIAYSRTCGAATETLRDRHAVAIVAPGYLASRQPRLRGQQTLRTRLYGAMIVRA